VFIDDDEYPVPNWICQLYLRQQISGSAATAGPIEPVYPDGTPGWVAAVDLHNKGNLKSGDQLRRVATGNCLLDMEQIGSHRFDPTFGLTGGSDALFFEQLADRGLFVVWQEGAIVYETIPESRTSSRYMIFRCMTQGQNFKRVVLRKASFSKRIFFMLKALIYAPVSLVVGALALPVNDKYSALWLKRGFTNLGKLIKPSKRLYG
jgi:succinoglycan biosynthesis protein ExoM